jgi:para-aminobenzoate synthetase component 1
VLLIDFEMQQPRLFTIDELKQENILVSFPTFDNTTQCQFNEIKLVKHPIDISTYQLAFEKVMAHLQYGNSFLTNLTSKTKIESTHTLDEIFSTASARYKINFKQQWICFSPETFIEIKNGEIFSYPMKGTIDAAIPNAEDILLNDKKEIAEHYTIVDLIRNDLSMVAKQVVVEKFRYVDTIHSNTKTLLQISSKIKGILPTNYKEQLGELLFTLLPAGSISGAPKTKTIEIIQEAEQEPRGYYTGVAFYFDGENIDSCVMIRFIENQNQQLYYRSGGGITINSEMEKEYQELLDKIYVPCI